MSPGFVFCKPVNPNRPLDLSDLPPEGWDQVETSENRKAPFGFPPDLLTACREWERRELQRYDCH